MTKTQIKAIALNASRQLKAVAKDVYNRDLVTNINHDHLKVVSASLNDLYGVLDTQYQRSMKAGIDEPMEYIELIKKRIDALAEYIRPTRLKSVHISPKQIVQMLDTEQQAMHHLSTLLDTIKIGSESK
jgi:mannose-6-phosphate isomerase class I